MTEVFQVQAELEETRSQRNASNKRIEEQFRTIEALTNDLVALQERFEAAKRVIARQDTEIAEMAKELWELSPSL
jgi:predicted  nucleic acid-binding Zn-ribbon protein